jgi:hypothetical protein
MNEKGLDKIHNTNKVKAPPSDVKKVLLDCGSILKLTEERYR